MIVFKFRLLSDEVENFVRDYELLADMTLLDFNNYIRQDLDYCPCEMASFFMSDVEWEKFQEFTLLDMGTEDVVIDPDDDEIAPPIPMSQIKLSQIITQKFDRMIYVFDIFAERQFFIELLSSSKVEPGVEYPRTVAAEGNAPLQLIDNQDEGDIFKDTMSDFENIEGVEDENLADD